MAGDWIKLHRKILDSAIFSDEGAFHSWIMILLKVNWRPGWFRLREIQPGQMAFSWRMIGERLHGAPQDGSWDPDYHPPSVNTMRRRIGKMQALKMVDVENIGRSYSVLTVCNWAVYQEGVSKSDTPTNTPTNTPADTPTNTPADTDRRRGRRGRKKEGQEEALLGTNGFVESWKSGKGKPIQQLTRGRVAKLRTRMAEPAWRDGYQEAIEKLPIPGDGWQPDFDWFVANSENIFKLIEGKYDWRAGSDHQAEVPQI